MTRRRRISAAGHPQLRITRRRFHAMFGGVVAVAAAERSTGDWPEWRGHGRIGVWRETGVLDRFPAGGLRFLWRTPIRAGYSAPSVAGGRVFVTDFAARHGLQGIERIVALNSDSGAVVWTADWFADYAGIDYASGPRAAPTVDGDCVYVQGAAGRLACFGVGDGKARWTNDLREAVSAELPPWGLSSAPLVVDDLLIAVAYGSPNAKVVAFDKRTGEERWRALSSTESGPGYSQPLLIHAGDVEQLILWHAGAVSALDPRTGRVIWEHAFPIRMETPIATPVWAPPYLLVSAFFNGARLLRVSGDSAELVWKSESDNPLQPDKLHALMASPVVDGGHIYGVCAYGQLRCLEIHSGKQVWETQAVTKERARNASAFLVRQGDRCWINNDRGELILARLSPEGYDEIDRTKLIEPTSKPGARRELGSVHWSHPAYAYRRIYARNDRELLCADLARSS